MRKSYGIRNFKLINFSVLTRIEVFLEHFDDFFYLLNSRALGVTFRNLNKEDDVLHTCSRPEIVSGWGN